MKCEAKLIAITQPLINTPVANAEELVAFCARVSSGRPYEGRGEDALPLLNYLKKNKHWSVFEMVNAVVEVQAPRDITRQLLRHRSFSFQEFSQRYSDEIVLTDRDFREQDKKNRQNSTDTLPQWVKDNCKARVEYLTDWVKQHYEGMRREGVAKETARAVLPEGLTMSTLYVNGTLRSWLHYLEVRDDEGVTQWEHVLLARKIREALLPAFPTILGVPHG